LHENEKETHMSDWQITRTGYEPDNAADNGNRFFIGNGMVGVRGTLEEYTKERQVAWNLAGVYDRAERRMWREPVNLPNGFYAALETQGEIVSHTQSLDFRYGIHKRETVYERARLYIERFASMASPDVLCQRITVEPSQGGVRLICGIDADVWDLNGPHLINMKCEAASNGDVLTVSAVTYEKGIPVCVTETADKKPGKIITEGGAFRVYEITEPTVIERVIKISVGNDAAAHHAQNANASEEIHNGNYVIRTNVGSYDSYLTEHRAVWDRLWADSEVRVIGDAEANLALNYSLYHLHSIAPRHTDNLSIAARGLSGQTYRGAVFWDTEIFLMPFFTLTEPSLARKFIRYRIDTLQGARNKAAEYGYNGAFFPWESQNEGIEGCTDFNITDVFTGRPVRTFFRDKQIHISSDIVYAIGQYARLTGDAAILNEARQLIRECADFYVSRAYTRPGSALLEFTDVVGPDEYHERVDNNAFTNRMAAYTLEMAGSEYGVLPPRINADGVIEQFDGYFKCEDASLAEVRSRLKHPKEYWGTQNGVAFATQIIKQADVLTLMYLFRDEFTDAQTEANWRYYEPRTEHGSSLSACMYALTACRFGRADLAYPFFEKSARADLDGGGKSWAGDLYIGGTHPAAAGGAYMIAVYGFAGLRITDGGTPVCKPCLPESIQAIEFPVYVKGKRYEMRAAR
jgi:kojibiose phosphorylase/nigerose phosphorylase